MAPIIIIKINSINSYWVHGSLSQLVSREDLSIAKPELLHGLEAPLRQ